MDEHKQYLLDQNIDVRMPNQNKIDDISNAIKHLTAIIDQTSEQEKLVYVNFCLLDDTIRKNVNLFYINERAIECYAKNNKIRKFVDLKPSMPEGFTSFNPSIVLYDNMFKIIVRGSNYSQYRTRDWVIRDDNNVIKTVNKVMNLSTSFDLLGEHMVGIPNFSTDIEIKSSSTHKGLEDCQLVVWNDKVWFISTFNDENNVSNMCLCLLDTRDKDPIGESSGTRILSFNLLESPIPGRPEKNWLPFVVDGSDDLYLFYSASPTIIYKIGKDQVSVKGVTKIKPELVMKKPQILGLVELMNSAGPIKSPDGNHWVVLVHGKFLNREGERYYYHRWVKYNMNWDVVSISVPWYLEHKGVEYIRSIVVLHAQQPTLLYGVGREDSTSHLYTSKFDM